MVYFYRLVERNLIADATLIRYNYVLFAHFTCFKNRSYFTLSDHYYDIGIECDSLIALLTETVYWKGIHFAPTNFTEKQGNSSLENIDIVSAFEGIKALKKVPDLLNVTIRDGASGLLVKELENHLSIMDTNILRSALAGANIESSGGRVVIENTTVQNTNFGDGFVYHRILDAVDFCSSIPDDASMPFVLKATGTNLTVNCSKVGSVIYRYLRLFQLSNYRNAYIN